MAEILVPLDGSAEARRALPLAVSLARASGDTLRLLQAVEQPAISTVEIPAAMLCDTTMDYLAGEANTIKQTYGLAPAITGQYGFAPAVILAAADPNRVSRIVMATHGRTGLRRAVLGSVAEQVVRRSPIPVILTPPAAEAAELPALKRVLVPLDGSALSYSVLSPVSGLALELRGTIILVRVYAPVERVIKAEDDNRIAVTIDQQLQRVSAEGTGYLQPIIARLRSLGIASEAIVTTGDAARAILNVSRQQAADMIALATHGRSGWQRMRQGSVAETVLRHSTLPVMTFGPVAMARLDRAVTELADQPMPKAMVETARPTR